MAAALRPVSHFSDDSQTYRSFPSLPASRPSFESSSMKSRKSFLDLIAPVRRRVQSGKATPASGSKLKQASEPAENMAIADANDVKAPSHRSRDHQIKTAVKQKAGDVEPSSKKNRDRSRPKSTILRVISTTFRSRPPEPPTSPPPASTSLQAKQNREDALRERGLLPPKPVKDLSRQEADQDCHNPTLPPEQDSFSAEPSAADLIRREWEAKNTISDSVASVEADERHRMSSFRFGNLPSLPASSPDPSRPIQLETVAEVNTPLPSPVVDGDTPPPAVPTKHTQRKASSHRSSASDGRHPPDPTFHLSAISPLPTPPATPFEPSKNPTIQHGDIDYASTSSSHNRSNSRHSSSSVPPHTNPVISLTPPGHISSFGPSPSTSSVAASTSRRSDSLTQMPSISESSSMMTPSLDDSAGSPTTISTLSTVDSSNVAHRTGSGARPKGRNGLLTVKTSDHVQTVPIIIESSAEDAIVSETIQEPLPLPIPSPSQGQSPTLTVPTQNLAPTRRERVLADTEKREKRKSFNPFKRAQSSAPDESDKRPRRISVSSSFGNLRRAASNWTKPRSSYDATSTAPSTMSGRAKTFDASHLPPSPTLPSQFMTPDSGPNSTSVGLRPQSRRPLQPTLHTRASIIDEMNTIKNDEVRRMTEVAFLG
ncbi:hypothetical protein D9756_003277 [Leucocoprinus leucothites]|uniref:Uncharacterized protein n=1 Tax=Leucocoprinus leucothites TaxID=201217 RepID=A0A8H5G715_9AGAR|nr:hypothetical protein D9756_003277 [Leucoagaricus leucothites]